MRKDRDREKKRRVRECPRTDSSMKSQRLYILQSLHTPSDSKCDVMKAMCGCMCVCVYADMTGGTSVL